METKTCSGCKETKPLAEFNKKSGRNRQPYCRPCDQAKSRAYYQKNKDGHIKAVRKNTDRYRVRNQEFLREYFETHHCVDCGNSDIRVLEFDHVSGEKTNSIAVLMKRAVSLNAIKKEIAKCEVRCANCHRIVTIERSGSWRSLTP